MVKSLLVLNPNFDPTKEVYTLNENSIDIKGPSPTQI